MSDLSSDLEWIHLHVEYRDLILLHHIFPIREVILVGSHIVPSDLLRPDLLHVFVSAEEQDHQA